MHAHVLYGFWRYLVRSVFTNQSHAFHSNSRSLGQQSNAPHKHNLHPLLEHEVSAVSWTELVNISDILYIISPRLQLRSLSSDWAFDREAENLCLIWRKSYCARRVGWLRIILYVRIREVGIKFEPGLPCYYYIYLGKARRSLCKSSYLTSNS